MTPEQYVELHARVIRLRIDSTPHFVGRDLAQIARFEQLTWGALEGIPSGREDEIYTEAVRTGKIIVAVVKWNLRVPVYCKWRTETIDGYIRKESGGVFVGNDHAEILHRIHAHVMAIPEIIVGGPDDPRGEGGLSQYDPK